MIIRLNKNNKIKDCTTKKLHLIIPNVQEYIIRLSCAVPFCSESILVQRAIGTDSWKG